mmetsp:Transcript_30134/g.84559  ORF Transcript_30134/g.84559 Transcript_30134/m.84559 type:complete len:287 (+) Transcript_30134:595-1455(+)
MLDFYVRLPELHPLGITGDSVRRTVLETASLMRLHPLARDVQLLEVHVRAQLAEPLRLRLHAQQGALGARAPRDLDQEVPTSLHEVETLAEDVLQMRVAGGRDGAHAGPNDDGNRRGSSGNARSRTRCAHGRSRQRRGHIDDRLSTPVRSSHSLVRLGLNGVSHDSNRGSEGRGAVAADDLHREARGHCDVRVPRELPDSSEEPIGMGRDGEASDFNVGNRHVQSISQTSLLGGHVSGGTHKVLRSDAVWKRFLRRVLASNPCVIGEVAARFIRARETECPIVEPG